MKIYRLGIIYMCIFIGIYVCACGNEERIKKEREEVAVDILDPDVMNKFLDVVQMINENSDMGFKFWGIVDNAEVESGQVGDNDMPYPDDAYIDDGSACGSYRIDPIDDEIQRVYQIQILKDTRNILGTRIGDNIDSLEERLAIYNFEIDESSKTNRYVYYWHKTENISILYNFGDDGIIMGIYISGNPERPRWQ